MRIACPYRDASRAALLREMPRACRPSPPTPTGPG